MDLLVVEDYPRICDVLDYALKADGYSVRLTHRGRERSSWCANCSPR